MAEQEFTFGLDELAFADDSSAELSLDNETYQDQANPAPPAYGNYRLRALQLTQRKTKDGEAILQGGKYPIFSIGLAEIMDGLGEGVTRKLGLFQDVQTQPMDRFGSVASGIGDLTRSYGTANWNGLPEAVARLREAFEGQQLFTAQLDWNIYDSEFIKAALEQLNIPKNKDERTDDQKKLLNAVYKAGKVTGMKYFPFSDRSGSFSHVLVRPANTKFLNPVTNSPVTVEVDARTLEGRPTVTRYFPNVEFTQGKVKLGPIKVKPAVNKNVIG